MSSTRKYFYGFASCLAVLLAGCGAVLVNEGAKNEPLTDGLKNPADMAAKVNVPADEKVICNFDDGSTNMSPKLYGGGGNWNTVISGGSITTPFIVSGGANGTAMAAHIVGTLVNKGDGTYPSFTLQAMFKNSGTYDASMFEGIRFYYKCPIDDKAPARRFNVTIPATLPSNNRGTCTDQCYNHFGADLSETGDWAQKSYAFGDLKRQPGWGSIVTPPDFTDHLKEIVTMEWSHNAGNTAGSYAIDYWVDEVEFF
ncbi:MAG TPA: hypothetical protein VK859_08695 [bacterium]|nr:hypothetical protein [bacterium]